MGLHTVDAMVGIGICRWMWSSVKQVLLLSEVENRSTFRSSPGQSIHPWMSSSLDPSQSHPRLTISSKNKTASRLLCL
ncbi:hypothetical protein EJ05DRAFT_209732 [Pseudovirgaria hyperparasitica]|uniref:Uncharacterized protein n=1 Tax=Pseudovirgaria hyperparasitica TaxID=470096 RepID=A0A6A6VVK7_9PEZI|nr:uncharacterized protein EJ05DRAFT_209732 [Pseudovirgaria hyperparasitica]KAF2753287.1 hypothetical protein EJ05DRAFT_209732 [Pseudovirgaria hyperparasitica]